MKLCNDTDEKKSVIGRKIDFMLVSMSIELPCSEWKKAMYITRQGYRVVCRQYKKAMWFAKLLWITKKNWFLPSVAAFVEQQQVKNCRTNSAIFLHGLKKIYSYWEWSELVCLYNSFRLYVYCTDILK